MTVRGGLRAYIFGKSPVLERIKDDKGFISATGGKVRLETETGFGTVSPTVARLRVNRVHSYGGEIVSVNPLHGPRH